MSTFQSISASRIEEIAQQWARNNSLTHLRRVKRRDCNRAAAKSWHLSIAQVWKIRNRALAIKLEERRRGCATLGRKENGCEHSGAN